MGYGLNPVQSLPDHVDYGCEITCTSNVTNSITIRLPSQSSATPYAFDGSGGILNANGAAINDLPDSGDNLSTFSNYTVTSDITLYILWMQ